MAESSLAVTPGSGASVRTRTTAGGIHQQATVIADGVTDSGVNAAVDAAGLHVHAGKTATSPTPARVTAAVASTLLLAANTARLGVVVHNDSTADLYVKFGTAASVTSYVYKVPSQGHLVLPEPGQPLYTGVIHGIWSAAAGAATVNEAT